MENGNGVGACCSSFVLSHFLANGLAHHRASAPLPLLSSTYVRVKIAFVASSRGTTSNAANSSTLSSSAISNIRHH